MNAALTPNELSAITRLTGEANGLPNRFYIDDAAAHIERDTVLATSWTCIGFASDLKPRGAKPCNLLGLPLMMVKDARGEVRVFHNVCRHRGHRLIEEPCTIAGAIRCPYHSWSYDFDGALLNTPHIGGHGINHVDGFDKSQRGLLPVRSQVWMDMVFINLTGTATDFDKQIQPLLDRWQPYTGTDGLAALQPAVTEQRLQIDLNCNWKLAVENYCESYHLPWVHPGLNSYSKIEDHYNIIAGDYGAGQGSYVFEFSERAGINLPRFEQWPVDKLKVAEYIALFPNVLLGLQNDHFYSILLMPLSAGRTAETLNLYYLGDAANDDAHSTDRKKMLDGWREVFLEDVGVCEGMQLGRHSPAFDGGAFSPALDVATHHFHKWVATRLPQTS